MKAMKYVGLATLAAVTLGFATPAFAADFETDVNVTVEEASIFTLEAVPSEYNFKPLVKNGGEYTDVEAETITGGSIEVFKGYAGTEGRTIDVTISELAVVREGAVSNPDNVEVTELSIAGVDLVGSGLGTLFADDDFATNANGGEQYTGNLVNDIDEATIGFTAELLPGDVLSGTVTYSVVEAPQ